MIKDQALQRCPCGSELDYASCCQPAISGTDPARTAEALMRSRYSAYALGEVDYLIATTHPDFRQRLSLDSLLEHHQNTRWLKLTIHEHSSGQPGDTQDTVRFSALFVEQGQYGRLIEHSNFKQENGRWYYCDGQVKIEAFKPQRKAPCPCGSGDKFKRCCG